MTQTVLKRTLCAGVCACVIVGLSAPVFAQSAGDAVQHLRRDLCLLHHCELAAAAGLLRGAQASECNSAYERTSETMADAGSAETGQMSTADPESVLMF